MKILRVFTSLGLNASQSVANVMDILRKRLNHSVTDENNHNDHDDTAKRLFVSTTTYITQVF